VTTSLIAMGIAVFVAINIVVGLGVLSLVFGTFDSLFGKPKFTILKPIGNGNVFAFGFQWNAGKEYARLNQIRLRLFNPFGSPTQVDLIQYFEPQTKSFAKELDMGKGFLDVLGVKGFENARILVEVASSKDGVTYSFEMKGKKFKELLITADKTVAEFVASKNLDKKESAGPPIDVPVRSFIADTVPGKGPQLKLATNPLFAGDFAAQGAGAGAAATAEAKPTFKISKVWIEPGCIVCNACEDIYPEVFEVKADTCIVRPTPPLDDGLRIQEAAEACPVEVIKFTAA
jgi:ferredoxin